MNCCLLLGSGGSDQNLVRVWNGDCNRRFITRKKASVAMAVERERREYTLAFSCLLLLKAQKDVFTGAIRLAVCCFLNIFAQIV